MPLIVERDVVGPYGSGAGWSLRPNVQWACDDCLESDRAELADPRRQRYLDHPPFLAYYNRRLSCRDCRSEFLFARSEQRHWYETLRFWVQARAVRCPTCRRADQARASASRELASITPDDTATAEGLVHVASLHLALGHSQQVVMHLQRAKNKLPPGPHRERLEQWISTIA